MRVTVWTACRAALLWGLCLGTGCDMAALPDRPTRTVTDMLGRQVVIPEHPRKVAALHHFGGKIIFALGRQEMLVEKSIYGKEATALEAVDEAFAAMPGLMQGHGYNIEGLVGLNPDLVFSYASMDRTETDRFEQAGVPVVAVKGETFEQSFAAVRLIADILDADAAGEDYIRACRDLLALVRDRLGASPREPVAVLFAGPKNIYSAATGEMLQSRILALSGARNVARDLKGFWADVSPEQISAWNPDVIFLGSRLDADHMGRIYENPHFKTIRAVQDKRVYAFPSNIGWWDYPAPHCVLGVVWSAKTLYPGLFKDIDMIETADRFYRRHLGHSFTRLGGRLDP